MFITIICTEGEGGKKGKGRERQRERFPFLIRLPILSDQNSTIITSFDLNYLLKFLSQNTATLGVRTLT